MTLEAMSASCGVVTTNNGAEFVRDEFNAVVAPVGSIRRIAESVERLVTDHELRKRLGTNAFETANKWSDPTSYTADLNESIQEIFDGE